MKITIIDQETDDDKPVIKYHCITPNGISPGYNCVPNIKLNYDVASILGIIRVSTYKSGEIVIKILDKDVNLGDL